MGGWGNVAKRSNPKSNSNYLYSLSNKIGDTLIVGRVIDILLDDLNFDKFKNYGEWNGIGTIQYETVNKGETFQSIGLARPLDSNIRRLPLINELVIIMPINDSTGLNQDNPYTVTGFYFSPIGVWNHPHHNAFPDTPSRTAPEQNKSYKEAELGSFSSVSQIPLAIKLGDYFSEKPDIRPLQPFEGDVIVEGRWGNSIRLGSTVMSAASISSNDWSAKGVGEDGDPIIIIRNGQANLDILEGYKPVVEETQNSLSSIYLTSTQNIPLIASSVDYTSYGENQTPIVPNRYAGAQILLTSGRLVFNSRNDHILLSSAKSINLNSKETVNIDTKKFITQADNIYLGKEDLATEPLLLGNTTVQVLKDLTSAIRQLTNIIATLQSDPVVQGSPATFATLNGEGVYALTSPIRMLLDGLEAQMGTSPENCTLTSKRNFTSK